MTWRPIIFAGVALACGVGAIFLVLQLAERDPVGDDQFIFGVADSLSEDIREDGPVLFGNPDGRGLLLYLQHQGDDVERGWSVFDARVGSCVLEWNQTANLFVVPEAPALETPAPEASAPADPACEGTSTVEADGSGQTQYQVEVLPDGKVVADIRNPILP